MTTTQIDWSKIKHFPELKERPDIEGVLPDLIYDLDKFRDILNRTIIVSPVNGAIVAKSGHSPNSYHYRGMAIDCFPICNPKEVFYTLLDYNPFGGIGIYFDTILRNKPTVMFHFDKRPLKPSGHRTWWFRYKHKRHYPSEFSTFGEFFDTIFKHITEIQS